METLKIISSKESRVWFTSDLHLQHKNICSATTKWTDEENFRKFDTLEKMDQTIIDNINKCVSQNDSLFILGDLIFGDKFQIQNILNRIICKNIYLIFGNHDDIIQKTEKLRSLFKGCYDNLEVIVNKDVIFLSHYSHRVWKKSHKGNIHLYGHSHGGIDDYGKSMDVGIDSIYKRFGEYRPISYEEIIQIMNKRKIINVDHHK